jgi:hypothetical protein
MSGMPASRCCLSHGSAVTARPAACGASGTRRCISSLRGPGVRIHLPPHRRVCELGPQAADAGWFAPSATKYGKLLCAVLSGMEGLHRRWSASGRRPQVSTMPIKWQTRMGPAGFSHFR